MVPARRARHRLGLSRCPPALAALRQERGIRLVSPPSSSWEHFAIRVGPGGHPSSEEKLVRRALAYGIDRTALVRQVLSSVPELPRCTTASCS